MIEFRHLRSQGLNNQIDGNRTLDNRLCHNSTDIVFENPSGNTNYLTLHGLQLTLLTNWGILYKYIS